MPKADLSDVTKIRSFNEIHGRTDYFGPPKPTPVSTSVPPPRPFVPVPHASPTREKRSTRGSARSEPTPFAQKKPSWILAGAVLAALYAWQGLHYAAPGIVACAVAGGLAGLLTLAVLVIVIELLKLAVKIALVCVAGAAVLGAVYAFASLGSESKAGSKPVKTKTTPAPVFEWR